MADRRRVGDRPGGVAPRPGRTHIGGMTSRDITVYDPDRLEEDRRTVERGFWRKARRVAASLPFLEDLLAAWYCAADAAMPTYVRAVLLGALAYFVLPFDVLPDVLLHVGFTDDAAVVLTALRTVGAHIPGRHRAAAAAEVRRLRDGDPA